ncbi:hypothetical protein QQ045_017853 [Rhodiola kirilowii]
MTQSARVVPFANPAPVVTLVNPADDPLYAAQYVGERLANLVQRSPGGVWMSSPSPPNLKFNTLIHSRDCIHAWCHLKMKFGGSNGPSIYALQEEIYAMNQGVLSIASYYGHLEKLWAKEDALTEYIICDLGENCKMSKFVMIKKDMDRVMKFFIGLNDVYKAVRTQILHLDPIPPIDKVYKSFITEKVQRGLSRESQPTQDNNDQQVPSMKMIHVIQDKLDALMGYLNTAGDKSADNMAGIACFSSVKLSEDS